MSDSTRRGLRVKGQEIDSHWNEGFCTVSGPAVDQLLEFSIQDILAETKWVFLSSRYWEVADDLDLSISLASASHGMQAFAPNVKVTPRTLREAAKRPSRSVLSLTIGTALPTAMPRHKPGAPGLAALRLPCSHCRHDAHLPLRPLRAARLLRERALRGLQPCARLPARRRRHRDARARRWRDVAPHGIAGEAQRPPPAASC